jgi:cytochrome c oxidase subunit IV
MMKTACWLLAIAAVGGLAMAGIRFAGKPHPPSWLAMLHGFLVAAAATLLLYAYFTVGLPRLAAWALLLFMIAAAGGVFMNLNYHAKQLALPLGLVIVHAGIAAVGFILLIVASAHYHPSA